MTEAEWLASADPQTMLAYLNGASTFRGQPAVNVSRPRPSDRKLRLFAAACCRSVWHLLTDNAPCPRYGWDKAIRGHADCDTCSGSGRVNRLHLAVEIAERYADGLTERVAAEKTYRAACHVATQLPMPNAGWTQGLLGD